MKITRYSLIWIIFFTLLSFGSSGLAEANVRKSVDINRQTFFNDITDAFATIGKSDHEKKRVKRQRQLHRKQQRLQDELQRKANQ